MGHPAVRRILNRTLDSKMAPPDAGGRPEKEDLMVGTLMARKVVAGVFDALNRRDLAKLLSVVQSACSRWGWERE
jgi:hypothetical protein